VKSKIGLISQFLIAIAACLAMMLGPAVGEDKFVAIQPQQAPMYHINFARNYFANPEAEKSDRANLYSLIQALEKLKGKIAQSADNLELALETYDKVQVKFFRHYDYLTLHYAINTKDETSRDEAYELDDEVKARTAFLQQEILQIEDKTLAAFVSRKPSLKTYLFAIEDARRFRPYTLSLKEEELLGKTSSLGLDWPFELYEKLIARTPFGTVRTKEGEFDVWKQRGTIAASPDRAAREEGFKKRLAGFASQRDLYAFTLIRLVRARNRLAQLRHFQGAADEAYFGRYWTEKEVNDLLEQIADQADLYKRYQRLRVDYIKKISGYKDINFWDLSVRPAGAEIPRFTIDQASATIRNAVAPLGKEYGEELAALLDPANGRMDVVPGPNRKAGGFSKGFAGTNSVFYSSGFAGYYNDMRILMHESTHAVQRRLMNRHGVAPANYNSPSYFFESFAIFNELLLPDYLAGHESDPFRKRYFLELFFEGKGMEMFVVAPEAILEQTVYDGVADGIIKGPDELDALTKRIYSRFSIWPEKHEELKCQWINIPLMYEDPFYDINYVFGVMLALKYYEMYVRAPDKFLPRYLALMSNGFDAAPTALLKRFLDIDLNDPRLVSDALYVLRKKLKLLEEIYQQ
jgi:oligoendopeptidase F